MVLFSTSCQSGVKLAHAKNIDYTPDVTSDTYWDTHHICAVRITNRERDQEGKEWLTYRTVRQISEGSIEVTRTVKLSDLWFSMGNEDPPNISVNDSLILYYAKQGPTPIVTTKLSEKIEEAPRVKALLQIAKFRANEGGVPAVKEGVFSKEGVVALYSLKRLLNLPRFEANAEYIARLTTLRANERGEAQVRILASRLAEHLGGRPPDSEQDYVWLKAALAQTRASDWAQLRPFVDRLLDFKSRRAESTIYLTSLVKDQDKPESVRIAAYSSFDDPRLFNFNAPDAESERVFETCLEMLKDSQGLIRRAGAALLLNISVRIDPTTKQGYVQRAKAAIEAASVAEKDEGIRSQLQDYWKMVSQ
ncbi:MAG: hypothetical protein HY267_04975 [Deltaproteobacteria bacterium]|nr:hypothetical protein [Deltaproteobacteria bacterium]